MKRAYRDNPNPLAQFWALRALLLVAVTFPEERAALDKYLRGFLSVLDKQILEDGGHITRSPRLQLTVLRSLIDIRAALRAINAPMVEKLQIYLEKVAPLVRLLRHGDGSLAYFDGAEHISPTVIDMTLSLADVRGRPPQHAPCMGFKRLVAKRNLVLLNIGGALPTPLSEGSGSLNFEWSLGRERIVLQGDIILQTQEGLTLISQRPSTPVGLFHKDQEGHILAHATYEAMDTPVSFTHHRQLYLNPNRGDFRGEDRMVIGASGYGAVRFVFPPSSSLSLSPTGQGALIKLESGIIWRLLAIGCDELIYEEEKVSPHLAYPVLLLLTEFERETPRIVKWAFRQD